MLRVVALLALVACSSDAPSPVEPGAPPPPVEPAPPPRRRVRLLVNTDTTLYDMNPDTLALTELGRFKFPPGEDPKMTDIALDRSGRLWGVSFAAFFQIDPRTLAVTRLGPTPPDAMINSLAVISSAATGDREKPDLLVAAGYQTSTVYSVDMAKGSLTPIGDLGGPQAAGDITWGPGVGPVITLRQTFGDDVLAKLEPRTLRAIPIGNSIGFAHVLGLAPLEHSLLGVTEQGEVIEIDLATGVGRLRDHHPLVFYGAAIGWADVTASTP